MPRTSGPATPGRSREKLDDCAWLVTCTNVGLQRLKELAPHPEKLRLVYHGLDFAHLPPPPPARPPRDGRDAADPVVILSVGRKVEKKGYDDLLNALATLPADLHWRFEHVGAGELVRHAEGAGRRRSASPSAASGTARQPQKAVFAALARGRPVRAGQQEAPPTATRTACPTC